MKKSREERFLLNLNFKIKKQAKIIGKDPSFLFLGEKELTQLGMCEGLFCPGQFLEQLNVDKPFGLEPVIVNRSNFLFVG